jgi:phosphoserine phosphatase RsbU/P
VGVVIAEVSGTKITAILSIARSRLVIQEQAPPWKSVSNVLRNVNNMFIANSMSGMFVTLFFGLLHYPEREIVSSNGGPLSSLAF